MIFASRQTRRSTCVPSALCSLDHGERVDLDEVGVVGEHRPQQALRDRRARLPVAAEPDLERQLAGRVVGQAEEGIGVLVDDRLGVLDGDLLDLDAALGGADEHEPLGRPVEHDREVVLLDDLGGRADQDAPDGEALDLQREDLGRDVLGLVRGRPASLTPPALPRPPTSTWALITTLRVALPGSARKRTAAARAWVGVRATSQAGTGRPWATSSDFASASWIFTRGRSFPAGSRGMARW